MRGVVFFLDDWTGDVLSYSNIRPFRFFVFCVFRDPKEIKKKRFTDSRSVWDDVFFPGLRSFGYVIEM